MLQNFAPRKSAIKVGQKLYFVDERLGEYRSVVPYPKIIEFIAFGREPWDKAEWICYHLDFFPETGCPDCHFTDVMANSGIDDLEPAPEDGGCMYNHDHDTEPNRCEWHD